MEVERDSLKSQLDSWTDQVKSLVSKVNQIDPSAGASAALKIKVDQITKEKESLAAWKNATEEEKSETFSNFESENPRSKDPDLEIQQQQSESNYN